jgi:hypothetical protein
MGIEIGFWFTFNIFVVSEIKDLTLIATVQIPQDAHWSTVK